MPAGTTADRGAVILGDSAATLSSPAEPCEPVVHTPTPPIAPPVAGAPNATPQTPRTVMAITARITTTEVSLLDVRTRFISSSISQLSDLTQRACQTGRIHNLCTTDAVMIVRSWLITEALTLCQRFHARGASGTYARRDRPFGRLLRSSLPRLLRLRTGQDPLVCRQRGPDRSQQCLAHERPNRRPVREISTYHWNDGKGIAAGGTVSLAGPDGTRELKVTRTGEGQGGVQNAVWIVDLDEMLQPGTYTVTDSDPSTWAQNSETGGKGMTWVRAEKR